MGQVTTNWHFKHNEAQLIVLAAGDGTRLLPLTQRLYGRPIPKQFAELREGRSLLQDTITRMLPLFSPRRITVVVPRDFAALARIQLERWPGIRVVVQPRNRGTGPGLLLPLASVLSQHPDATVVVVASDHDIPNFMPFLAAIAQAIESARQGNLTLLGVQPNETVLDYGWILPSADHGPRARKIVKFVEKPTLSEAEQLHRAGGLWNTLVLACEGRPLWNTVAAYMPVIAKTISALWDQPHSLDEGYASMPEVNLSRSVLEREARMSVIPVKGSGWSDWGSPERVFKSLRDTGELPQLLKRIKKQRRPEASA
jgi:mannose-1-phosphate guanylyltransferase